MITAKPFATGPQSRQQATRQPAAGRAPSRSRIAYGEHQAKLAEAYKPKQAPARYAPGQRPVGWEHGPQQQGKIDPWFGVGPPPATRTPGGMGDKNIAWKGPHVTENSPLDWETRPGGAWGPPIQPEPFQLPGGWETRFPSAGNSHLARDNAIIPGRDYPVGGKFGDPMPPPEQPGNYANMRPDQRPPAFQQSLTTPFGEMAPEQFFNQRNDFVSNILAQQNKFTQNAGVFPQGQAPQNAAPQWGNPASYWPGRDQYGDMIRNLISR